MRAAHPLPHDAAAAGVHCASARFVGGEQFQRAVEAVVVGA